MPIEIVRVERCEPPEAMGRLVPWCRVTTKDGASHEQFVPNYVETALGGDERGFFCAAWSSVVGWGISGRVSDQDW